MFAPLVLKRLADVSGSGTPGADEPFFKDGGGAAAPLVIATPIVYMSFQVALDGAGVLTATKNGVALLMNSGAPLVANAPVLLGLMVQDGDEINFEIDSGAKVIEFEVRGHREYF